MAIRYRKGRASPWQCYWNNPLTGKRECANFATRHEAEKHDSLIKHRLRFDRESFRKEEKESETEKKNELTLEAAYLLYLRQKQFTKKNLGCHLSAMRQILQVAGDTVISEISKKMIEKIMTDMQKMATNATVYKRMSQLRAVLHWSNEQGYCDRIEFPRLPSPHYKRFIPPTTDEISVLLHYAAPHIQRVILIGVYLGARVGESELLKMTWNDVDVARRLVRIRCAQKNPGAEWREVPIRKTLLPLFEQWQAEDLISGAMYLINYNGSPVRSIKTAWASTLRRAGITRRIRPYDLRHAFATELIANGTDIGTVSQMMGHSSPMMVLRHYQYVMDKQKQNAVESLPDVPHVPKCMCPKKQESAVD